MKKILVITADSNAPIFKLAKIGLSPSWVKEKLEPRKGTQDEVDKLKLATRATDA